MTAPATNFPEWDARQREMRALEGYHRAPYGAEDFKPYSDPSEISVEGADPIDREYEDEDRGYDLVADDSPTGMTDRSVRYYTALGLIYREKANGSS